MALEGEGRAMERVWHWVGVTRFAIPSALVW